MHKSNYKIIELTEKDIEYENDREMSATTDTYY